MIFTTHKHRYLFRIWLAPPLSPRHEEQKSPMVSLGVLCTLLHAATDVMIDDPPRPHPTSPEQVPLPPSRCLLGGQGSVLESRVSVHIGPVTTSAHIKSYLERRRFSRPPTPRPRDAERRNGGGYEWSWSQQSASSIKHSGPLRTGQRGLSDCHVSPTDGSCRADLG